MTDTKQLKDEELKKVAGGEGTTTYKYVFTDKDWVYENCTRNIVIHILENVSTNDSLKKVLCKKTELTRIPTKEDGTNGNVSISAGSLLSCYQGNGGNLHAM